MAALAPVGAVVGAAIALGQQVSAAAAEAITTIGRFGAVVATIDGDGLAREFAVLGSKLPIVGVQMEALGGAVSSVIHGLDATAQRLASWNPQLLETQINNQLRDMFRDMERAERLGPDLARYAESRQNLKEQLEDIEERILSRLVPIVTRLLEAASVMVNDVERVLDFLGSINESLGPLAPIISGPIPSLLGAISRNTRPRDPTDDGREVVRPLADLFSARPLEHVQERPGEFAPRIPAFEGV